MKASAASRRAPRGTRWSSWCPACSAPRRAPSSSSCCSAPARSSCRSRRRRWRGSPGSRSAALLQDLVGFGRGRAVGAFGDHAHALGDLRRVVAADLVLDRRRDQDVDLLFQPGVAGQLSKPMSSAFFLSMAPNLSVMLRSSSNFTPAARRNVACPVGSGPTTTPPRLSLPAAYRAGSRTARRSRNPARSPSFPPESSRRPSALRGSYRRRRSRSLRASERAAHADRLARDQAGMMAVP